VFADNMGLSTTFLITAGLSLAAAVAAALVLPHRVEQAPPDTLAVARYVTVAKMSSRRRPWPSRIQHHPPNGLGSIEEEEP
jgi:predicted MFS family arabinose efflux permease